MAVIVSAFLGAGCGGSPPSLDASFDSGGSVDATPGTDTVPPDARADAGLPDTGLADAVPGDPDADPCAACTASSECMEPICDGLCAERPVADGTTCAGGDVDICVAGACVPRACGDGYREPGPTPAREGCDDGATDAGDACSPTCEPAPLVVAARPGELDTPTGGANPAIGIDDAGGALLVWTASDGGGAPFSIHARRFSPGGVPLDAAPIAIATGFTWSGSATPTVAGLVDGWVVTWASPAIDGDLTGVAYRLVAADGTLGPAAQANEATFLNQYSPTVARHGDGFAIAWTDQSELMPGVQWERIQGRLFTAAGAPAGPELDVSTGPDPQQAPAAAGHGDTLLVTWTAVGVEGSPDAAVVGRRFDTDGVPIDATPFLISDRDLVGAPAHAFGPSAAALPDGWAVAWTAREDDYAGDVRTRAVPLSGPLSADPSVLVAGEADIPETMPSVAPLGDPGYAVLWHRASTGSVVDDIFITPVGTTLAPEAADLSALLTAPGNQQAGSLAAAPGRLWIAWSDDGSASGALRTLVLYVLAVE